MKICSALAAPILFAVASSALAEMRTLLFQDDFERSESQETVDEPGSGWGTNSKLRAKGHKQVDLRDGAMYISRHAEADHSTSVTHAAEFQDGAVRLRVMLEDERDILGLNFADLLCKEVHAGHLISARINVHDVHLEDLKTGIMRRDICHARLAGQPLNDEQQAAIKGKSVTVPHPLEAGRWYEVEAVIRGDRLSVFIDGQDVASLVAPGIDHPTKRLLRLAVPRNAVVDDVMIWRYEQEQP